MLVDCETCNAVVDAQVLQQYSETIDNSPYPPHVEHFSFAKCPVCKSPMLLSQSEYFSGPDEELEKPTRLFPSTTPGFQWSVPQPIEDAFAEATKCYKAKAFTASAIMCRKTLEGVSADHGATGSNLEKKLASLKEKGVIEGRLFEWANELRLVGNDAAHDVAVQVIPQDARDTLDFTQAVLQYVYTLRDRFEEFKKRRVHRKAAKTAAAPKTVPVKP